MIYIVVTRRGRMRLIHDVTAVDLSQERKDTLSDWVRAHRQPPFPAQIVLSDEECEGLPTALEVLS